MRFVALQNRPAYSCSVISVDLGYARVERSTGVCWGPNTEVQVAFGSAVRMIIGLLNSIFSREVPVLIVEAPLSGAHDVFAGNPTLRGAFESGHQWSAQAGAHVALGSLRLFHELDQALPGPGCQVEILEAYAPTADIAAALGQLGATDAEVARYIHDNFSQATVWPPQANWQALSPSLVGVPAVLQYP